MPLRGTLVLRLLAWVSMFGAGTCLGSAAPALGADDPPAVTVAVAGLPFPAPEIDAQVAIPLATAIGGLAGVQRIEVECGPQRCELAVRFRPGEDAVAARLAVRDRVAAAMAKLPQEIDPPTIMAGARGDLPRYWVAVRSDRLNRAELAALAHQRVRDPLLRLPRVRAALVLGAGEPTPTLTLDARKLAATGLTVTDVAAGLARPRPAPDAPRRPEIAVAGPAVLAEFEAAIVRPGAGGAAAVRLRDVAQIELVARERGLASVDGEPAVLVAIVAGADGPSPAAVAGEINRLRGTLPPEVRLDLTLDLGREQRTLIEARWPQGTSAAQAIKAARELIRAAGDVADGADGGRDSLAFSSDESGPIHILVRGPAADVRTRLADVAIASTRVSRVGGGHGLVAFPVRVALVGPDRAQLHRWADAAVARLRNEGSALDVASWPPAPEPRPRLKVDRARAAELGVTLQDLARLEALALRGMMPLTLPGGPTLDVRLDEPNEPAERLATIHLRTRRGDLVPLAHLAELAMAAESVALMRVGSEPAMRLSAAPPPDVSPARATAACLAALAAERAALKLPDAYRALHLTSQAD